MTESVYDSAARLQRQMGGRVPACVPAIEAATRAVRILQSSPAVMQAAHSAGLVGTQTRRVQAPLPFRSMPGHFDGAPRGVVALYLSLRSDR